VLKTLLCTLPSIYIVLKTRKFLTILIAICSHCSYLLYKFAIYCFFKYSVCFIRVIDCPTRVSQLPKLQGVLYPPLHSFPQLVATPPFTKNK